MTGETQLYTAYIEEVMRDEENKPTLGLRVRIPSKHGRKETSAIQLADLPIAYPLVMPGSIMDLDKFDTYITEAKTVTVMVRDGRLNNLYYLGFTDAELGEASGLSDFDILDGGTF